MDGNFNNNQYGQQPAGQAPQPQFQQQAPQFQQAPQYNSGINYGAPIPPVNPANAEPYPIGKWLGIMFLSCIPCVGFILLFVWAFGDGNESRKNWAKAELIFMAIWVVISIILYVIMGATLLSLVGYYGF